MPANLPPHYYELERQFRAEKNLRRRLEIAKELFAIMPKHKGTDKLQAEMKAKISKLKKQIQSSKKHGETHREDFTHIEKEGAGQVIIIGPPNSGKSTIVGGLTNAKVIIADYPYSTLKPITGMMQYEDIQIQLIDTPPISPEFTEKYIPELTRKADFVVITIDATSPGNLEEMEYLFQYFKEKDVHFHRNPSKESFEETRKHKKAEIFITHIDEPGGGGAVDVFSEFYGELLDVYGLSIPQAMGVKEFKNNLFKSLGIIRTYCKERGKPPDLSDPVILYVGDTVNDMALEIHKDFAYNLKFAKIWGKGVYDGQMVAGDYQLNDGDIVELHI